MQKCYNPKCFNKAAIGSSICKDCYNYHHGIFHNAYCLNGECKNIVCIEFDADKNGYCNDCYYNLMQNTPE